MQPFCLVRGCLGHIKVLPRGAWCLMELVFPSKESHPHDVFETVPSRCYLETVELNVSLNNKLLVIQCKALPAT